MSLPKLTKNECSKLAALLLAQPKTSDNDMVLVGKLVSYKQQLPKATRNKQVLDTM